MESIFCLYVTTSAPPNLQIRHVPLLVSFSDANGGPVCIYLHHVRRPKDALCFSAQAMPTFLVSWKHLAFHLQLFALKAFFFLVNCLWMIA